MPTERIKCSKFFCKRTILPTTAEATGGKCMPHYKASSEYHLKNHVHSIEKKTYAPPAEWVHGKLGSFIPEDWRWYNYDYNFEMLKDVFPNSEFKLGLSIEVNEDDCEDLKDEDPLPPPSSAMIVFTEKVLSNLDELVKEGITTLWNDILGTGESTSGMWWHDRLDEICDLKYNLKKPNSSEDLAELLEPVGVDIDASIYQLHGPVGRIMFSSILEEEHGISFLTDGNCIIGLGYIMDPGPFKHLVIKK